MPDDTLNPYAPPAAANPLASVDAGKLWIVQGGQLLVRDGARLPPVSLFGDEDGELTPSHQVFAAASGASLLALVVPFTVAVVVMVLVAKIVPVAAGLAGLLSFIVSGRLFRRFARINRLMASIQCYLPVAVLKARARRDRWRSGMILAALGGFLLLIFSRRFESMFTDGDGYHGYLWEVRYTIPVFVGTLTLFGGAVLWASLDRWLKCVRHTGGWFYLTGVPASSLMKLFGMSAEPPPLRTRTVYTLYQYRLPLRILLGTRRNPLLILIIAVLKLFRSPALVRQNFHWSERRRNVQPGQELAQRIAEFRSKPEFASWKGVDCSRLDTPKGDMSIATARFASPDRRHYCHLTLFRLSKARAFAEVFQSDFRTWTEDGRCLVTSSQPPFPRVPDHVDFQRVRGDVARVGARHLQRCEQVTPRAFESDEEVRRLLEQESEDHAERLRAARIQGPVEEVEMPGDWEDLASASRGG